MMNKDQRLFTAGGVLSFALTVGLVVTGPADAQGPRPSTPVTIVDPIPVPISGTVATIDNGVRRPVHYLFS